MEIAVTDSRGREFIRARLHHLLFLLGIPRTHGPPAHIEAFAFPLDAEEKKATHYGIWVNEKPFAVYSVEKQNFTSFIK